jgi:hypothetical protein
MPGAPNNMNTTQFGEIEIDTTHFSGDTANTTN